MKPWPHPNDASLVSPKIEAATIVAAWSLTILALVGCDSRPDQWDAFVYPGDNLLTHVTIRGFKTFEQCQEAAIERLRSVRRDGGGDYECGYKCGPATDGLSVCKETRK